MNKIKVSFDFDSTLDREALQRYAAELLARPEIEVWVVTSRCDNEHWDKYANITIDVCKHKANVDLFEVTDRLGIPRERIVFTNMADKADYFLEHPEFLWHLDDDWIEIPLINKKTQTIGIQCYASPNWKGKCERLIKKTLQKSRE